MKEIKNNHTKVLAAEEQVKKISGLIRSEKTSQAVSNQEKNIQRDGVQAYHIKREVKTLEEKKTDTED